MVEEIEKMVLGDANDDLTDQEIDDLSEFVNTDLKGFQDIQIIERDERFTEGCVVVFFKDYMIIRHQGEVKLNDHSENLAMDVMLESKIDITEMITRESISSVSMIRQPQCDCEKCKEKIAKGEGEEQSEDYHIKIDSARLVSILFSGDKDLSSFLHQHIIDWRFQKNVFSTINKKVKSK